MTDIDQYQSRIFAALDKISRVAAQASPSAPDDGLAQEQQRNAELIEELESALAEEKASLQDERAAVAALKGALLKGALQEERAAVATLKADLANEQDAHENLKAQIDENLAAASEAADSLAATKDDLAAALSQAKSAASRVAELSAKLDDAETALADTRRQAERNTGSSQALEDRILRLNGRIESQDMQFQRLKDANAALRDSNAALRQKNIEMLADPDAINTSMAAELSALKTARAADVDEMDTILQELKPLVEGQTNA